RCARRRCRERPPRGGARPVDRCAAHARGGSGDDGGAARGPCGAAAGGVAGGLIAPDCRYHSLSLGRCARGVPSARCSTRRTAPPIPSTGGRNRGSRRVLTVCSASSTLLSDAAPSSGALPALCIGPGSLAAFWVWALGDWKRTRLKSSHG